MAKLPVELQEVFQRIERDSAPLAYHDVSRAIGVVADARKKDGSPISDEMQAEAMAFDFCEDYKDEGTGWGTYYGPQMVVPCEGGYKEWPSIRAVREATLAYWASRSEEAIHPVLRARYADLVWDLTPKVSGKRADIVHARTVIDSYATAVAAGLYQHRSEAVTYADRALMLAISLNDTARIEAVRNAILTLDAAVAPDEDGAGIAFDLLVGNKKVPLPPETLAKLIEGQERILARGVENAEKEAGFPFSVDRAAERLAVYYRSKQNDVEVKRVGGLWARAKIAMAKRPAPMLGAAWLRDVHARLVEFGCAEAAEIVAVQLRDVAKKSMDQMVEHTATIEIPKKEIDDWTNQMLEGGLEDVLIRIVGEFIPDPVQVETQVKKLSKTAVLTSLLSITQVDAEGRQVAEVGSIEGDLQGRVVQQIGQNLQFEGQFLHHLIREMVVRHKVTADVLVAEIYKSPLFEQERQPVVRRGLDTCLTGDHIVAAHLLMPQIEHALRLLCIGTGGSAYKASRRLGGLQLKTFGDLLVDEGVVRVLGDRIAMYLRVLFTDPRGWNLRNDVLHGIISPDQLGWGATDRLLHVILLLGSLRTKPT